MSEDINPAGITDRIRSSLVVKLNIHFLGRLISGFLSVNLLIVLLGASVFLWKAESRGQEIIGAIEHALVSSEALGLIGDEFQVLTPENPPKGILLPGGLEKLLPIKTAGVKRSISLSATRKGEALWLKLGSVKYNMAFTWEKVSYRILYDFGSDLQLLLSLLPALFVFELLILIKNLFKGSRAIKDTLKPLSEMAEKTRRLNAEVSNIHSKADYERIKDLAGALSDIDANRLDKRISVQGTQNELKDLASAINEMLNRINVSYQSQLRFVSDASHELRTPISVVQGYANLLDRWGKNDEKTLQESIDAIKSETQGMKELVEQLLFLARGDNETIELHKEEFDAADIAGEIVCEAQMIDTSHVFEMDFKSPVLINADKQLFKQAIRILADNAMKYTPPGEIISIKAEQVRDFARITVQDNGIGIAPGELADVFERFYRSDESRARRTGGSGLGLSIAKWIIERHGGHFEVLSRENIGTRITVVMPKSLA